MKHSPENATLDEVISYVSPTDAGGKLYRDTEAFQNAFIKGVSSNANPDAYAGDKASLEFVANYLECLTAVEEATWTTPNGSILFDHDADFTMPIDPGKEDSADIFKFAKSNTFVESSVSSDTGAIGGGTSHSSDNPWSGQSAQKASAPAMAAKQEVGATRETAQTGTDAETAKAVDLDQEPQGNAAEEGL